MWLYLAYLLEFQGINTFLYIWLASCVFFIVNVVIITYLIRKHKMTSSMQDIQLLIENKLE